ncbi:MAG: sulfate ABC transporter permease subunit [Polyangiales bacterium]
MSRGATRPLSRGGAALVGLVVAYLGLVLVVPLIALVQRAIAAGWGPLVEALRSPAATHGLAMSLTLAAIAVVVNGVAGVAGALVLVRHRFAGRRALDALVELPLAISPVAIGLAFLLVFGRNGWLEPALLAADVKVTFAFPGMVLATLFVTLPFTLREVAYVLEELGTAEEEAAATLGASRAQIFWRVTLPNLRHALGYGVLLTAARALGEFGAVLVVGGDISESTRTATTFIYASVEERNEAGAYGMALVLAAVSALLLLGIEWTRKRRQKDVKQP